VNTDRWNHPFGVAIKASRDIEEGEEILIDYSTLDGDDRKN